MLDLANRISITCGSWLRRGAGPILLCASLAGCASSDPNFYTLQSVPGIARPASGVIELRRPGLAGYLDRSDVVFADAGYKLRVNSGDRWAEPLGDMIGRVLAQDLTQRLSGATVFTESGAITANPTLRVEIDVLRFDQDSGGAVVLQAQVAVEGGNHGHTPIHSEQVTLNASPSGPGAAALAATMSGLLGQLSDRVAASIASAGGGLT